MSGASEGSSCEHSRGLIPRVLASFFEELESKVNGRCAFFSFCFIGLCTLIFFIYFTSKLKQLAILILLARFYKFTWKILGGSTVLYLYKPKLIVIFKFTHTAIYYLRMMMVNANVAEC
jgi:hypothetical protein